MFGKHNGFVSKARVSACMYFLVNEYKLYVSIQKSSKYAKFEQCLYLGNPFVMSRTDAQNGVEIIFNGIC
jgi:hypothetical protein